MGVYILKRLLLILPTLLGIILINFIVVQFAPGGPVEQIIAQATTGTASTTAGISGGEIVGSPLRRVAVVIHWRAMVWIQN